MLYGVAVELKAGGTEFFVAVAADEQDARSVGTDQYDESEIESIEVMSAEDLVVSQYSGLARLGTS